MPLAFIMPKFDMDQEKATIVTWLKKEGDFIKTDESVLVVETEKVAIDVPAPATGTLVGIRFKEGDVVPVTQVIAYVLNKNETLNDLPPEAALPASNQVLDTVQQTPTVKQPDLIQPTSNNTAQATPLLATPVAIKMAKEEGIDLSQVPASGERITREDVESFIKARKLPPVETAKVAAQTNDFGKINATPAARRISKENNIALESILGSGPNGRIQAVDVVAAPRLNAQVIPAENPVISQAIPDRPAKIIPLVGIRQKIAQRLQASFQESPHISLTVEADVTRLEAARSHLNNIAVREKTSKISLTALLVKVVAWALERNPYINASLIDNQIYLWQDVNIGVATALEDGLIVPVIHKASHLSVRQIADSLGDLSVRAREGRLSLSDVQRGTFTISNLGMFGIQQFRAIINPPESAILAVGSVVRKPIVIDEQDTVAVRPIMTITIAADHRVIDGVVAARFLSDIVQGIEFPETLLY